MGMNRFVWTPRLGLHDVIKAEPVAAVPGNHFEQDDRREVIATLFLAAVHWQLGGEDLRCNLESIYTENLDSGFGRGG